MRKILYSLIIILPLLVCSHFLKLNGYCQALPDFIIDPNSYNVIEGGLSDAQEFGLSVNNGNIYALPVFVEETLNPYLYQNYGYDLEDIANITLSPLDVNGETLSGLKAWSSIDRNYNTESSIASAINNGIKLCECKLQSFVSTAKVLGTSAKAFILGQVNQSNNTVSQLSNNVLFKLGDDFSETWSDNVSGLNNGASIIDMSSPNQILYNDQFQLHSYSGMIVVIQFDRPCYLFTSSASTSDGYAVNMAYLTSNGQPQLIGGSQIVGNSVYPLTSYRLTSGGTFSGSGVSGYSGYLTITSSYSTNLPLYSPVMLGGSIYSVTNLAPTIENTSDKATYYNYYTTNYNNESVNISDLLKQLDGKYVTGDQLGEIKELIDSQAIANNNSDSAGILFSDSSLQDLIDLINGILNDQSAFDESIGEPEPVPDPDPVLDANTGIGVPSDFPISSFDTLSNVISSPLEFFSIFEPVFMIFGSSALMILGLWLFVPCVLIIAFIFKAFK